MPAHVNRQTAAAAEGSRCRNSECSHKHGEQRQQQWLPLGAATEDALHLTCERDGLEEAVPRETRSMSQRSDELAFVLSNGHGAARDGENDEGPSPSLPDSGSKSAASDVVVRALRSEALGRGGGSVRSSGGGDVARPHSPG